MKSISDTFSDDGALGTLRGKANTAFYKETSVSQGGGSVMPGADLLFKDLNDSPLPEP